MMLRHFLTASALVALAAPAIAQQANGQGGGGGVPGLHFVENWDMDRDGTVTLDEMTERRGEVFYMFDQDENGLLDDAEYAMFDDTRAADMENAGGHGQGMQPADQGMGRDFNDTDGDGMVSRDEFVSRTPEWLALMDRDGSGDITTADFGPRN